MTHGNDKKRRELEVFDDFVRLSRLSVVPGSIENRDPPAPDIYCEITGEGPMAFELTEFADSGLIGEIARVCKHPEKSGNGVWTADTASILGHIFRKFTKIYESSCPIDLICYEKGRDACMSDIGSVIQQMREYLRYLQQHGQFHPDIEKEPGPEFYLRDGQEWMRFWMDPLTEYDGPATDAHRKEYHKEYKIFKADKRPSQTIHTPNKNQFRHAWFMSVVEGEECCERIV